MSEKSLKEQELLDQIVLLTEKVDELEFEKENRFYDQLFKNSRDGYVINKGSGEFINSNPAFINMLGYNREEIFNVSWKELTPEKWLEWELETHGTELIKRGYTDLYEKEYIKKDGTIFPIEIQAFLLNKVDKVEDAYIAAFVRDISERKLIETQKNSIQEQLYNASKLASLGVLAAGIAHEINNPLTILLHSRVMIDKAIQNNKFEKSNLEKISKIQKTSIERIANIVKGILNYSRLDNDKSNILNINSSVMESINIIQTLFEKSYYTKIELSLCKDEVLATINSGKLQQVLINLFTNAKDAMEDCPLKVINVKTYIRGDMCFIEVSDSGCGIKKENLDLIYNTFFTTKKTGEGTGLGLGISKSIIEDANGTISLESNEGVGTVFSILLPLVSNLN